MLAALDVRKNEVPLSLYAAASIGSLNAPSLYFIEAWSCTLLMHCSVLFVCLLCLFVCLIDCLFAFGLGLALGT